MDKLTLYHGSNSDFTKFDYKYIGKGNDEEGPGFYLTSSLEDARKYGKYVHVVDVYYRRVVPLKGKKNANDVKFLIMNAPNYKDTLQNWDENWKVGLVNAIKAITRYTNSPHELYQQTWIEFYRYDPVDYVKSMIKLGYDGVLIKRPYRTDSVKSNMVHFVAFDPDKLHIKK